MLTAMQKIAASSNVADVGHSEYGDQPWYRGFIIKSTFVGESKCYTEEDLAFIASLLDQLKAEIPHHKFAQYLDHYRDPINPIPESERLMLRGQSGRNMHLYKKARALLKDFHDALFYGRPNLRATLEDCGLADIVVRVELLKSPASREVPWKQYARDLLAMIISGRVDPEKIKSIAADIADEI